MASFPDSQKVFTPKVDLVDVIQASHVNELQEEVAAIEEAALDQDGIILTTTKVYEADVKETPSDNDVIGGLDSADSYKLKGFLWSNIRAAILFAIDSLYAAVDHVHDDLYAALSHTHSYAPVSHNHAGTDITSGQVPVARLGTGTPDGFTYLRGDGTWATIVNVDASTGANDVLIGDGAGGWEAKTLEQFRAIIRPGLKDGNGGTLTIASGSITPTHKFHSLDTEGAAATDDLVNIVPTNAVVGDHLTLVTVNSSHDVVLKDSASGANTMRMTADFTLNAVTDVAEFVLSASSLWLQTSSYDTV